jgi:malate dehydrogenase (quinone)
VSGIWLRRDNSEINSRHHAKVYGMASVGSPLMSAPHLDTRVIGAAKHILFSPYPGFYTKFLKHGSLLGLHCHCERGACHRPATSAGPVGSSQ